MPSQSSDSDSNGGIGAILAGNVFMQCRAVTGPAVTKQVFEFLSIILKTQNSRVLRQTARLNTPCRFYKSFEIGLEGGVHLRNADQHGDYFNVRNNDPCTGNGRTPSFLADGKRRS